MNLLQIIFAILAGVIIIFAGILVVTLYLLFTASKDDDL